MQRQALRAGLWLHLHRGVLALAGTPDTPARRLWAGHLALGPSSIVSHRGAVWSWSLGKTKLLDEVEFSVPRNARGDHPDFVIHRTGPLTRRDFRYRDGLPVTSPLRTLVDAGAVIPLADLEDVFDRVIATQLASPPDVLRELEGAAKRGRAGCGALRAVLLQQGLGSDRSPSYLEAKALRLFRRHGLPEPRSS